MIMVQETNGLEFGFYLCQIFLEIFDYSYIFIVAKSYLVGIFSSVGDPSGSRHVLNES